MAIENLFLTIFDLRSSTVLTFSIAAQPCEAARACFYISVCKSKGAAGLNLKYALDANDDKHVHGNCRR